MLRIANIIEEGKLGGPQVRIANVACAIKDKVETTVVLPVANSERFIAKLETCGTPYKKLNLSRITKDIRVALQYIFFSWFEIIKLAWYFRKEKFDLVHVSGGSWQYKGVIASKLAGRKVVWHLNDTSMPWIFRKIFSSLSALPDAYIFASEKSQTYYKPLISSKKNEYIIPAPVDTEYFSPDIFIQTDKALINDWDGKTVIGTVANVNPVKGLDVFIRVAADLNKEIEGLVFVVVGPISASQRTLFNNLKALMAELGVSNIQFIGRSDDPRAILKRMDIYLCTSYAESSPISVWEAMSMGKTIVSTDVGDVKKYVIPGKSGEIVPVGDVENIKRKIIALIGNKELMLSYSKSARKIAIQELDIKFCAEKHLSTYEKILNL